VLPIKKKYFSLPLFGVYLIFFVFFNNFGKLEKELKNATLQRRIECRKHTSSKHTEDMDAQGKGTYAGKGHLGKILHGPKVSRRRGKVLQGLRIRNASDGSVERKIEPTLGQRRRYEKVI
jgi:hypothetical protein